MNYYSEIKQELINNKIYKKVKDYSKNKSDLETYYKVGKLIVAAQGGEARAKYGDNLIREYSKKLTNELGRGYNVTTLKRMIKFYILVQKGATLWHQLSWSHYRLLLTCDDINKINYYSELTLKQNLSVRELYVKIKLKEYERLDNNTKDKMVNNQENKIEDYIKNPIIIRNKGYEIVSEKILKL